MNCNECKYKLNCAMLSQYKPIAILVECGMYKECSELNAKQYAKKDSLVFFTPGKVKTGANLLKRILKYKYPQYKWSVSGRHFANGNSIDAYYTDSKFNRDNYHEYLNTELVKTEDDNIQRIANLFQEGHFDGMTDMYEYNDDKVLGSAKYCTAKRKCIDDKY